MNIDSTANKYKESTKDSWMDSQTKPVGSTGNQIDRTAKLYKEPTHDTVMDGAYKETLRTSEPIQSVKDKKVASDSYTDKTKQA